MSNRYDHYCDGCKYLGTINYPAPHRKEDGEEYCVMRYADLYYCPEAIGGLGGSLIARYSSKDSNYASMPANIVVDWIKRDHAQMSTSEPALVSAYIYAKALGYLKGK